ncbi:protein kintoun [Euwallacea fornicatus]|uniref:protein kintoun n=1 Tax=Euwallacea fornicatus TaxID=995702 RepID=UPI00338E4397
MASSCNRLKELDLSRDEVNRLGEALKNEEFRKLLADYAEEIQDPNNRQIYEEEVKQLERERGQEVTFLHPDPGYVIKTSLNGDQKVFINVCSNENINKPTSTPTVKNGSKGLHWSVPHTLSPPREELDNKGIRCQVYDALFHPNTLHLASKNRDFRSMINDIALSDIENSFDVNLDKKNLKFPKLTYKGLKQASIIRKPVGDKPLARTPEEQEFFDKIYSEIDSHRTVPKSPKRCRSRRVNHNEDPIFTTPKYLIKHRSHLEFDEFVEHKNAKLNVAIPKELIVEVDLPLLKSSIDMQLDVTEKTVQLLSEKPAKYKLNLTLPYQVNENGGAAKFDKDLKKLVITLPVKRKMSFEFLRDDSGVDSCLESDLRSPSGLESDEDGLISVIKTCDSDDTKAKESKSNGDDDFLNSNDLYNLPEFTCNVFDNIVAFTFNVKNVDEQSVCKKVIIESSFIKVKFTNISSSFYSNLYAFYVKFPQNHILSEEDVNIETWDNNVILQVSLKASDQPLESFLYGMCENDLMKKLIEEPAVLVSNIMPTKDKQKKLPAVQAAQESLQANIEIEKMPSFILRNRSLPLKSSSSDIDILATSYESSGDELSSSSFSPRKSKGILKRISVSRANFGRSISESSLDDFFCSSFENCHGSIGCVPEDDKEDYGTSSSLKKTVRFNDVVVKQLFRSNSSILGQKKKNQRKARNKKRSHERRYSESEASDVETNRERDDQTIQNRENNTVLDGAVQEPHDEKDDVDIFHLEINN